VLDQKEADFTNPAKIRETIRTIKPAVIVNAVAYTAVDQAEEEEALAYTINAETPDCIAEEAKKLNALLVHYSTDYVFDGKKTAPYTESDEPCPINAYGRSKLAGEQAIAASNADYMTFRTSWVSAHRGHNFLKTILRLATEREELSIVSDQIGAPTSARLIADTTAICLHQAMRDRESGVFNSGLYHLTAAGHTSWHGLTEKIVNLAREQGLPVRLKQLKAITTAEYLTSVKRPLNSRLQISRLERDHGVVMPDWTLVLNSVWINGSQSSEYSE